MPPWSETLSPSKAKAGGEAKALGWSAKAGGSYFATTHVQQTSPKALLRVPTEKEVSQMGKPT